MQYTLDFPWYASLPRVEARTYLDQYGGKDDVWIGKTLYRCTLVLQKKTLIYFVAYLLLVFLARTYLDQYVREMFYLHVRRFWQDASCE